MVLFYHQFHKTHLELLSTSCTACSNQGFTIDISEAKYAPITLEISCKKVAKATWNAQPSSEFNSYYKHLSETPYTVQTVLERRLDSLIQSPFQLSKGTYGTKEIRQNSDCFSLCFWTTSFWISQTERHILHISFQKHWFNILYNTEKS